jgi:hypothetical protein
LPTTTLFQRLDFGDITFYIEVVAPVPHHTADNPPVLDAERVRTAPPVDPWGDEPITMNSDGTAVYSPTVKLPLYKSK